MVETLYIVYGTECYTFFQRLNFSYDLWRSFDSADAICLSWLCIQAHGKLGLTTAAKTPSVTFSWLEFGYIWQYVVWQGICMTYDTSLLDERYWLWMMDLKMLKGVFHFKCCDLNITLIWSLKYKSLSLEYS